MAGRTSGDIRVRMQRFPLLIAVCCFLMLFGIWGLAQNPSSSTAARIRVNSDLVLIPVTVLDRHDESVAGLLKTHFKLYEDNVEQVITHFAVEDAPISVGFVLDVSSSMQSKMHKSRAAIENFLNIANPEDEFFLVQFSDHVEMLTDLTTSTGQIESQLASLTLGGRTALLDAIQFSIHRVQKANNARKALIIVSDGGDNCSRYTLSEIKKLAREADAQIYAIGIFEPSPWRAPEEVAGPSLLHEIGKQSGGRAFMIANANELPQVAAKIGEALRSQYVLGYVPKSAHRDGKYHRIEVRLAEPKGLSKLQASWRRGYYAPTD
jgi:Ca-activated chloride channel family protein